MIFTLVSTAQEKLVELMESMKDLKEKERQRIEDDLKRQAEVSLQYIPTNFVGFEEKMVEQSCLQISLASSFSRKTHHQTELN